MKLEATSQADQGDTGNPVQRVLTAVKVLERVCDDPMQTTVRQSLIADKGYFSVEEVCCLQGERVRLIIGEPHETRQHKDKQSSNVKYVPFMEKVSIECMSGTALLSKRGEHLERSLCEVLERSKHRRATLGGLIHLVKCHVAASLSHKVSMLIRHLIGYGTINQYQAGNHTSQCGLAGGDLVYLEVSGKISVRRTWHQACLPWTQAIFRLFSGEVSRATTKKLLRNRLISTVIRYTVKNGDNELKLQYPLPGGTTTRASNGNHQIQ